MEVKIGIENVSRELSIDADLDADGVQQAIDTALGGQNLVLQDKKGRRLVVPGSKLAYVEVSTTTSGTVGFRS